MYAIIAATPWTVFLLNIILKSGGLAYHKVFHETGLQKVSTNDFLTIASTFHGIDLIAAGLNPIKPLAPPTPPGGIPSRPEPSSGIEVLETENFRIQCFTSLTGIKFLLFTDTTQTNVDVTLRRIYDLYTDYVMKNPFHNLQNPVRSDIFDRKLLSYIREINNR
ncbi:hypothetical protein NQ176_g7480 [Zarea fungicola]|uniref:Uncharacterized protein n=1 Tax=Zarea fungicola TaxID=93591 RepID=A0ACC1MXX4_9HYPO|nr:hypothetical protein NQ176_g7480 [Lecanicillium fungicola]